MLKMGQFYLTTKGRLVKIFNSFKFQDGFTCNAAIYKIGTGWIAVRYTPDGRCNVENDDNRILAATETFEVYRRYMTFYVWFNRTTQKWNGRATDPYNATIVDLQEIDNEERAMNLIKMGAEEKLLTWMREAGYDEETKETVNG